MLEIYPTHAFLRTRQKSHSDRTSRQEWTIRWLAQLAFNSFNSRLIKLSKNWLRFLCGITSLTSSKRFLSIVVCKLARLSMPCFLRSKSLVICAFVLIVRTEFTDITANVLVVVNSFTGCPIRFSLRVENWKISKLVTSFADLSYSHTVNS